MKKRYLFLILKVIISIVLISYVFLKINKNNEVFASFELINLKWVSIVIILMIPNILIQAFRWYKLLNIDYNDISYWQSVGSTLGGFSLGLLTPGKIGELGKSLFLKKINKLKITGLALLERAYNMIVILLLGLLAFISFYIYLNQKMDQIYLILIALISIVIITALILIYKPSVFSSLIIKLFSRSKHKESLIIFFESYTKIKKNDIIQLFTITVFFQLLNGLQFVFAIWAFDSMLTIPDGLVSSFATTFTKAVLPISIADIGIRENAAIYYFSFFINNKAAIFNGSLLIFFVNVIFPSLCGLFMLPKMNFQKDL